MSQRAALSVGVANLLARVTGFARDVVMAAVFGAGMVTDAFFAASRVAQLLRELLAEGSLQNVVVPAFSRATERDGASEAWKLANAFLGVLLLVLGAVTLAFVVGADLWVRLVANGFAADPEKFALTASLTRWMAPFLAGVSIAAFFAGMLNVRGHFFVPALAQNALNLLVLAACLGADTFERWTGQPGIAGVALATTLSGFVQVALTWPLLRRDGFRFRPTLRGHPALRGMLATMGPAFVGIVTVQASLLIESQWASTYGDGVVSYLLGSFRLVQLPLALIAGSLATAALATLSAQRARGDGDGFRDTLAGTLRTHAFFVVPSSVALFVLAEPLVRLFYERGAFTAADTAGTAAMLRMYAVACFGICFHRLVVPVYYALGNPKLPMWLSLGAMAAKVPVILLLTRGMGMGYEALPLSHAVTVGGESVLLAWGLRGELGGRGLAGAHLRVTAAAAVLAAVAWWTRDAAHVVVVCALSGGAYLVAARALGVWELGRLRRPRGLPPFVDPETQVALRAMAAGGVRVDGDRVSTASGAWRIVAKDGALGLIPEGSPVAGEWTGPVQAVVRVQPAPPRLGGLLLGARAWHADGDEVRDGPCAGPRIPVEKDG